jgi:hypothetical protein
MSRACIDIVECAVDLAHQLHRTRKLRTTSQVFGPDGSSPVHDLDYRKFLRQAFHVYRALRERGIDLRSPILQLVGSYRDAALEDRFHSAENALAKLVALLREKQEARSIEASVVSRIKSALKDGLEAERGQDAAEAAFDTIWNQISKNLGTIDTWSALERILTDYGVEWRDLYPPDRRRPSLLYTRARLYHASGELDSAFLTKEVYRCRALVERLILRLFEWKDLNGAPLPWSLPWFQSDE